jgi:hypothetical protein
MNIYDIGIEPGGVHTINVQAEYIYFRTGTAGGGDTTVVFQPNAGGESVYLQPGQAYKMPAAMRGKNVTWVLRNLKGEGRIAGVILMGEGEFQDNRVSGSVEVIDGGKARTMANTAFMMMAFSAANPAAYSMAQLWNPIASGKNLIVEQLVCSSSGTAASGIFARFNSAPLAGGSSKAGTSKKAFGAPAIGMAQSFQVTPIPATTSDNFLTLDKNNKAIKFSEPLCLPPGTGLFLFNLTVNEDLTATFEWFEEAAV